MSAINSISENTFFEPSSSETKPQLSRWEEAAKLISIWVVRGLIFAVALAISGTAAALGLQAGGVAGLCVVTALIGGFAFATAMAAHDKAMEAIDRYFEERVKKRALETAT